MTTNQRVWYMKITLVFFLLFYREERTDFSVPPQKTQLSQFWAHQTQIYLQQAQTQIYKNSRTMCLPLIVKSHLVPLLLVVVELQQLPQPKNGPYFPCHLPSIINVNLASLQVLFRMKVLSKSRMLRSNIGGVVYSRRLSKYDSQSTLLLSPLHFSILSLVSSQPALSCLPLFYDFVSSAVLSLSIQN